LLFLLFLYRIISHHCRLLRRNPGVRTASRLQKQRPELADPG